MINILKRTVIVSVIFTLVLFSKKLILYDHSSLSLIDFQDEIYFFPAKKTTNSPLIYQKLKQFDMIFTGYDVNASLKKFNWYQNIAALIPGYYTHTLMYIGKDINKFAYAVEMNQDKNRTFSIDFEGMHIGGGLHLICLGSDYGKCPCPNVKDSFTFKGYDYYWARRLKPKYNNKLTLHKNQFLSTVEKDLHAQYPFRVPFDFSMMTPINKIVHLIDDGHRNGSDCVSYFVSLFEHTTRICFDNIRINAKELQRYYLYDPLGQRAMLPSKYNPTTDKDIPVKEILEDMGILFVDNPSRSVPCDDGIKTIVGIPTPDMLFNSSYLQNVESCKIELANP